VAEVPAILVEHDPAAVCIKRRTEPACGFGRCIGSGVEELKEASSVEALRRAVGQAELVGEDPEVFWRWRSGMAMRRG